MRSPGVDRDWRPENDGSPSQRELRPRLCKRREDLGAQVGNTRPVWSVKRT